MLFGLSRPHRFFYSVDHSFRSVVPVTCLLSICLVSSTEFEKSSLLFLEGEGIKGAQTLIIVMI